MKRLITFLLALCLVALCLSGCATQQSKNLTIVTTTFAEYDWTRQLLGEDIEAELILLTDNGTELHSYQPTPENIIEIAQCDLFIYTASEQLPWLQEVTKNSANPDRVCLDLAKVLDDRMLQEEPLEGMEHEHHEEETDQHIWLSIQNAQACVGAIKNALVKIDPANDFLYLQNAEEYSKDLLSLELLYKQVFSAKENPSLLFADRFPFRYMAEDYGITCYAAFPGCSSETNASFETVLYLAEQLKQHQYDAILILDGQNESLAQTVLQTAGAQAQILSVDSMQSVTAKEIEGGKTYYDTMIQNLEAFKKAVK